MSTFERKNSFRQFLTRFLASDWFGVVLKIRTEQGSIVPLQRQVALETLNKFHIFFNKNLQYTERP